MYAKDQHGIVGLLALKDVVRTEAVDAVKSLKEQGIHTVMITGDSEKTAEAISKNVQSMNTLQNVCLKRK